MYEDKKDGLHLLTYLQATPHTQDRNIACKPTHPATRESSIYWS